MSDTTGTGAAASPNTKGLILTALVAAVLVLAVAALALGPVRISPGAAIAALVGQGTQADTAIIQQIRLPRMALGLAVGAALALSGAALQGLLRNPLAEPGLIGVTAGATLGAVSAIVLGGALVTVLPEVVRTLMVPIAAFLGSAIVILVLFTLVRGAAGSSTVTLILAGVAINAIVLSAVGALIYISNDQQLRELTFWTLGSLGTAGIGLILTVCCLAGAMVPVFLGQARALDLLQLGERAAFHTGLDVDQARLMIALATALAVGAVTAAAGPIGFIGLVAPHLARLMIGPEHRLLLPASALTGMALVLAADLAVRTAIPPAEPPIGLATSLIGGPFFLWLLLRQVRKGQLFA